MAKRKRVNKQKDVKLETPSSESTGANGMNKKQKKQRQKQTSNKSQKRHMRKMQRKADDEAKSGSNSNASTTLSGKDIPQSNADESANTSEKLNLGSNSTRPKSALQQAFLSRLAGSRFRELNEDLYTTNSSSAFERFQSNPELFDQYHEGFRTQVMSWPVNPVDVVYKWILSVNRTRTREEQNKSQLRIADFGCGDAKLAKKLLKIKMRGSDAKSKSRKRRKKNRDGEKEDEETDIEKESSSQSAFKVHSFDLVANGNPNIQPCDMANVPLANGTVDIGVFVLALMGTNIADFIREAHRVLTPDGKLKIAEVRSRFERGTIPMGGKDETRANGHTHNSRGGRDQNVNNKKTAFTYSAKKSDDSLLYEFLDVMNDLGFRCTKKDRGNKMFILLEFEKTGKSPSKDAFFTAKPCIYKRR